VNVVYNNPTGFEGLSLVMATFFFAFQIYCDFAGYSLVAIGSAEVMGFRLMRNFDRPYLSKSISEFWSRWHISLSSWFRDYVYIPLGGNRVAKPRWYYNLFITFLLSGLWHGANWTFIIWGTLNGFFLIFSLASRDVRESFNRAIGLVSHPRFHAVLSVLITFTLTCMGLLSGGDARRCDVRAESGDRASDASPARAGCNSCGGYFEVRGAVLSDADRRADDLRVGFHSNKCREAIPHAAGVGPVARVLRDVHGDLAPRHQY
jgi:hypothetical protein